MPKIVKPMDPVWIVNYNSKVDSMSKDDKTKISDALAEYEDTCDKAADKCNTVLLEVVPI
jgi:hypothetical protein